MYFISARSQLPIRISNIDFEVRTTLATNAWSWNTVNPIELASFVRLNQHYQSNFTIPSPVIGRACFVRGYFILRFATCQFTDIINWHGDLCYRFIKKLHDKCDFVNIDVE